VIRTGVLDEGALITPEGLASKGMITVFKRTTARMRVDLGQSAVSKTLPGGVAGIHHVNEPSSYCRV